MNKLLQKLKAWFSFKPVLPALPAPPGEWVPNESRKEDMTQKIKDHVDKIEHQNIEFLERVYQDNVEFDTHHLEDPDTVINFLTDLARYKMLQEPDEITLIFYDFSRDSQTQKQRVWFYV